MSKGAQVDAKTAPAPSDSPQAETTALAATSSFSAMPPDLLDEARKINRSSTAKGDSGTLAASEGGPVQAPPYGRPTQPSLIHQGKVEAAATAVAAGAMAATLPGGPIAAAATVVATQPEPPRPYGRPTGPSHQNEHEAPRPFGRPTPPSNLNGGGTPPEGATPAPTPRPFGRPTPPSRLREE